MNWYLLETGISNAAISFMIALIAVFVGKTARRPHLAHLLWLLVLAKLLMPAHISFAFDPFPPAPENISSVALAQTELPADSGLILGEMQAAETDTLIFREFLPQIKSFAVAFLPAVWIFGIFAAIVLSIFRVVRFNRLLTSNSESAPESVLKTAFEIADKLELRNIPSIRITNASIAPMVWWVGGKVRVFIPHALIKKLDPGQLRLVIAHELAHVKRRDFLVRWIEWLAGVLFWWNPVVWWAQRNIRANEEICCDSLVLTAIKPKPHEYAASLLSAVESFTESAYRPPAMASEINSGGYLLRRVNMILSGNNSEIKRRMQIAVLAAAALVLPLGLTFAQDKDPDSELRKKIETITKDVKEGTRSKDEARNEIESIKREIQIRAAKRKLDAAVSAGKMSPDEAQRNLEAVRKNANAANKDDDALRKAREEIASALKKGTISKEEAAKRTLKLKLAYSQKKQETELKLAAEKLRIAVSANLISEAEANARLIGLKRDLAQSALNSEQLRLAAEIKLAVRDGQISKEEAERRIQKIRNSYTSARRAESVKLAEEKLKLAVKANQISKEEAELKLNALRLKMSASQNDVRLKSELEKLKREAESNSISKAEAEKRMAEIRKRYEQEKRLRHLNNVKAKLEYAVKAGNISEAEAKAKLQELERQLQNQKDN